MEWVLDYKIADYLYFLLRKKKQQRQDDICKSILPMRSTGEMFSYCLLQEEGERRRKEENQ